MSGPQFANFRRFVLTGSIAAVTATGAWYGAGLKMKQDIKQVYVTLHLSPFLLSLCPSTLSLSLTNLSFFLYQEKQKAAIATPLQQITELETYRANLMQKKIMLDKKIEELEVKKRKEERRRVKELRRLEKEKAEKGE
jgi:hypothetical protein